MEGNTTWEGIKTLTKKELLDLLAAYDEYVYDMTVANLDYDSSVPVGVCEFYEYDYQQNYIKGE